VTDEPRRAHLLRTNWRQPLLTIIGMSAAIGLVALVDPQPGPLVLAAVLAMTVGRNKLVLTWRGRAEAVVLLPVVGLATAGVGYLFISLPIVGAVAYVVAMFLSIYLRRFGPLGSRIGTLIALPFITLLIAPGAGVGTTPLGVALLSIVVLAIVVALRLLAEVTRFLPTSTRPAQLPTQLPSEPQATPVAPNPAGEAPKSAGGAPNPADGGSKSSGGGSTTRPIASTRMAIQMALALAAAFVIGALVFPQHITWVVLTAFIVCSGNRGRADVLYKSGLRIVGAAIGTIVASIGLVWLSPNHPILQGPSLVIVLLVILGVGLWLREWTYAAWAVAMTLVITLLQGVIHVGGAGTGIQLWIRILAIIVGAACGLGASWFVLPVRSEGVVRKRISESLSALSDFAADPNPITDHDLGVALEKLDEVAKPWNTLEALTGWRATHRKPGQWMHLVHQIAALVRAKPQLSGQARKALGEARRSMRDPLAIGPNLLALRDELQAG
jgi:hypothetical protein